MEELISDAYRAEQVQMHAEKRYGKSGGKWWTFIVTLADKQGCKTWLDYGCGNGKLAENIRKCHQPFEISEYDPGVPGKDIPPTGKFDLVTCCDVLEHIEPDKLDAVLRHIAECVAKRAFVVISTRLVGKELPSGRNAHLIVKPKEWWEAKLTEHFSVGSIWSSKDDEWCFLLRSKP